MEVYVVDNVNMSNSDKANAPHDIGYQQTSTTRSDITFEFYEVTQFPEKVSFTYDYFYNGVSKKTEKFDVYTYKPYPAVTVPDFIKQMRQRRGKARRQWYDIYHRVHFDLAI